MKCREASGLMHRYVEDKLVSRDRALLEEHTAQCNHCKGELQIIRRLQDERPHQMTVKAPEGFTDNVMAALNRLPPERRPYVAGSPDDRWKMVYRRLGYSLILTAGIIMFSLLVPVAGLHPESISGKLQSSVESTEPGYKSIFSNIDAGIMSIFKNLGNSESNNKGGTDNGM